MSGKYHLAIDLGTYNSAAAVLKPSGDIVTVSASSDSVAGRRTGEHVKPFPSVVVYHPDGAVRAVGQEAKALAETEPRWAVWGVKRLLGKTYREALAHGELGRMLIPVEPDDETGRCMFIFDGRDVRPEDVCAEILRYIRSTAEKQVDAKMPHAVISVPAYFDAIAISATVEAAKRAGFEAVETIPEPVAAAFALDLHITPRPVNFLVFDIGAGTLDVTAAEVVRTRPGPSGLECRCRKNTGDTHLGGLDMDDRLVEWLTERMKLPALNAEERLHLRRAAEAARIALTTQIDADVELQTRGQNRNYHLDRLELEEALRSEPKDLLEACAEQVRAALKGADWKPEDVERLLLVGGPAAMPCIVQMLSRIFRGNSQVLQQVKAFEEGQQVGVAASPRTVDRMMAVSQGAAKSKGTRMVKQHAYGYGFVDSRMEPIAGEPMAWVHREARILVERDSVFPSDSVLVIPQTPYYRRDHIFSLELLQHVPKAEQAIPGMGTRPYRYLGEFQIAFRRVPFLMQVSMRLNENGELETTLRNLLGPESATYVGLGSPRRVPIELPASKREPIDPYQQQPSLAPDADGAQAFRTWGAGLQRFLGARVREAPHLDSQLAEGLNSIARTLETWGSDLTGDVQALFNATGPALTRARDLKLISEAEFHRFDDEFNKAWERCWKWKVK